MKEGDLVNFHTEAWVFKPSTAEYKNPGIILNIKKTYYKFNDPDRDRRRLSAEVLWADGRITTEHECYLQSHDDNI